MKELKLILILLTAPIAIVFALSVLRADYALYTQVRDFGEPGAAVVDRIADTSFAGIPGRGQTLTYTLEIPGHAEIVGAAHMSRTVAQRYSAGQEIQIVYAASDPRLTALSVEHAWRAFVSDVAIFAAYAAVLALTIALIRTGPRKRDWLARAVAR